MATTYDFDDYGKQNLTTTPRPNITGLDEACAKHVWCLWDNLYPNYTYIPDAYIAYTRPNTTREAADALFESLPLDGTIYDAVRGGHGEA